MTSIKDLESCRYFPVECDALTAIGWLGKETTFETGPVSEEFFCRLTQLCSAPWQPIVYAGLHFVNFVSSMLRGSATMSSYPIEAKYTRLPWRSSITSPPTGIGHRKSSSMRY
jgi:hypothetical protein